MTIRNLLRDSSAVQAALSQVADAIINEFKDGKLNNFSFIGMQERGVPLARRLKEKVEQATGYSPEMALLDISMYRDDIGVRQTLPVIRETSIPFDINDRIIILVDDVLSTGRTIRAALDAINDYGRPSLIKLAVLVDRGNREYPIRADYSGLYLETEADRKILVEFAENPEYDGIYEIEWTNKLRKTSTGNK
jgi:pyrimidine operon attenuation protein/uracil phosphoribosyltransferase